MNRFFFALLASTFIAAVSNAQILNDDLVIGVQYSKRGITIQVPSGGCTGKSSFTFEKERVDEVTFIDFKRVKADRCQALLPYGISLTYSFDELGLESQEAVMVGNPLVPFRVFKGL